VEGLVSFRLFRSSVLEFGAVGCDFREGECGFGVEKESGWFDAIFCCAMLNDEDDPDNEGVSLKG
jgi:hypothetical protein